MMSSYIPKQPKRERDQISIKLDRDVLQKLEQYGRFLESSRDYIINSALELAFRKDKAFAAWLETEQASGDAKAAYRGSDRAPNGKLRRSVGLGQKANGPHEDSEAWSDTHADRESHSAEPSPQLLHRHRLVPAISVS